MSRFFMHEQKILSFEFRAGLTSPGLHEGTGTTTAAVGSSSWPHFDRIFMISALTGDGVDDLRVRESAIVSEIVETV